MQHSYPPRFSIPLLRTVAGTANTFGARVSLLVVKLGEPVSVLAAEFDCFFCQLFPLRSQG